MSSTTHKNMPSTASGHWLDQLKDRLFQPLPTGEDIIPLTLSIGVGLITGLSAFSLIWLLKQITGFATQLRTQFGPAGGIGLMIGAGVVTGLIINNFAKEAKGHGVPEVMEAIALNRGRIRPRVAAAKIIASAITIGTGGSAGREGPIVQVGAALGSTAGQLAHLTDEQVGILVASGAAAGIAATFNAPIAGSMFALEVILGNFSNRHLGMVVVSAVSANVVSRALLGENPAFQVPAYPLNSPLELPLYFVVSVFCAVGAALFIRVLYNSEHFFDNWPVPLWARAAVGMGLAGAVGLAAPEVLGPGLEFIGRVVANDVSFAYGFMLFLLLLKLVATSLTIGSGNSGGVFAPTLFMGAMIGGLFGTVGHSIRPDIIVNPGAYALVGMAAMLSGAVRAPITAIIIVLEMSNDYRLILPLLMAVVVSTLIGDIVQPDTIYTKKLALRGIRLRRGQDIDLLQTVDVEEVMTKDYLSVGPDASLGEVARLLNRSHHHGFPIIDRQNRLLGIVTLTDIDRAEEKGIAYETPVVDVATTVELVTVFPDDPMHLALQRMNTYKIGRLPVVTHDDARYVGMIRRSDIMQAYEISLTRRFVERRRRDRAKLRLENSRFVDVEVAENAPMVGQKILEFPLSDKCLIVSLQRGHETIVPHGHTTIQPGDWITIYGPNNLEEIEKQFGGKPVDSTQAEIAH